MILTRFALRQRKVSNNSLCYRSSEGHQVVVWESAHHLTGNLFAAYPDQWSAREQKVLSCTNNVDNKR